jgi:hypothetical protein
MKLFIEVAFGINYLLVSALGLEPRTP